MRVLLRVVLACSVLIIPSQTLADSALSVAVAPDDFVVVSGVAEDDNNTADTLKYSPDGNLRWMIRRHGELFYRSDVRIDTAGNVYVHNVEEFGYSKYSADGDLIYTATFDDFAGKPNISEYIEVSATGDVVLAGMDPEYNACGSWIVRFSGEGTTKWSRYYDPDDCATSLDSFLFVDNNDNSIIMTNYKYSGDYYHSRLQEYDALGWPNWGFFIPRNQIYFTDLSVNDAGEVFPVGVTSQSNAIRFFKLDSEGKQVYEGKFYFDGLYVNWPVVVADSFGGAVITASITNDSYGSDSISITLDENGAAIWQSTYPNGYCWKMRLDSQGQMVISGGVDNGNYNNIGLLYKYDLDGTLLWDAVFSVYEYGTVIWDMAIDSQDNIYVVGQTCNQAEAMEKEEYICDYFTSKFSGDGELLWTKTYDSGLDIIDDADDDWDDDDWDDDDWYDDDGDEDDGEYCSVPNCGCDCIHPPTIG